MPSGEDRHDSCWLSVVDEIRAALMEASRRDVADRVPAGIPTRFVEEGRWTLDDAVERARRVSTPGARVGALAELASSIDGPVAERLWTEAIRVAATRGFFLGWRPLFSRLPPSLHHRALETIAGIGVAADRVAALGSLLPHLPPELIPAAFGVIAAIDASGSEESSYWVCEGLTHIAGYLPLDLVPDAFNLALRMRPDEIRITALLVLSGYLPAGWPSRLPPERGRGVVAELAGCRARKLLADESEDLLWQDLFTELLPARLLADAVAATATIDPEDATFVLAGLAPRLPTGLLERAWTVAEALPAQARARALIGVLPYLVNDARLPCFIDVLAEIASVADEEPPGWMKRCFLPHVPDPTSNGHGCVDPVTETWNAVIALPDGWRRDYLVARMCPRLPAELLPEALDRVVGMMATAEYGAEVPTRALVALVPRLEEPLLAKAWDAAIAIRDPDAQNLAFAHLAPRLPASLIGRMLRDAGQRSPRSSHGGAHPRFTVLQSIAPRVPDDLLADAVHTLTPLWFDPIYAPGAGQEAIGVMAGLVDRLPPVARRDVLDRALRTIASLDSPDTRAQALARFAAALPDDLLAEALTIAVSDLDGLDEPLAILARRVPLDLLLAPYAALTRIGDAKEMAALGAALITGGPADDEPIDDEPIDDRPADGPASRAWGDAAAPGAEVEADRCDAVATATMLPIEWSLARRQVEEKPPLPAEPLRTLVARIATTQVTEYPEEARAWALAGLAPHLAPGAMREALALVAAIVDTYDRGGALVGLAPYLPDHLRAEALDLARALPGHDRLWTLAGFAPWLGDEDRQRLVETVHGGMTGSRWVRTLTRLAPWLPDNMIIDALAGTISIERPATVSREVARLPRSEAIVARDRADVVAALVRAIPPENRDRMFAAVLIQMAPYTLGSIVDDLLPYLPTPLAPRTAAAVVTLLEKGNHCPSVHPLVARLPAGSLASALAVVDPSRPATIAAILRRARLLLAGSQPVRLAALIRQGLRITQQTRARCRIVVAEAARSLTALAPRSVRQACAAVLDEVSGRWP